MVHAIDPTFVAAGSLSAASPAVLEAQLRRYETQLAAWCDCPSGKTATGKQKIADLQAMADAATAQLQQVEAARSDGRVAKTAATIDAQSGQTQSAARRLLDVVA